MRVVRVVSDPLEANVWVVVSGGEALVVDAGAGVDPRVVPAIRRAVGDATVKGVHLTHLHCDHCGGAKAPQAPEAEPEEVADPYGS